MKRFIITMSLCLSATAFLLADNTAEPKPYRGELLSVYMENSIRYPGTHRRVQVYVPEGYTGQEPACVFVRLDGMGPAVQKAMDELIAAGEMPMTLCVNVPSGRITDANGTVVRYNRSNEYDRMTPTWAEFLEYEVFPLVETLKTQDGRPIRLSRRPEDRAINGLSSSGICAFTAAWQHPDFYSRVYSIVGTFVPMRGGDTYPGLVRKMESKPIRIFMQDNNKDTWNLNLGSWYEYNVLLANALQYAGYDVKTQWDEGGHDGRNGENAMKDVLRWLWSGWPEAIEPGESGNKLIRELIVKGEAWTRVENIPVKAKHEAVYPGGAYVVRPKPHSACLKTWILVDGKEQYGEEFYWLHTEGANLDDEPHLAFDTEGYLYASTPMGIQVCDQNGRVRAIIATPVGTIEAFGFEGNTVYVQVNKQVWKRIIGHTAATKESPTPKSQDEG